MIVFRLLAVFIFVGLLTGCAVDNIRGGISQLRAYFRAFPSPDEGLPPGSIAGPIISKYRMKIESFDEKTGVYVAQIDFTVVKEGNTACEKTKTALLASHQATQEELLDYPCLDPDPDSDNYPYHYLKYQFRLDNACKVADGGNPDLVGQVVELESVALKPSLKCLKIYKHQ